MFKEILSVIVILLLFVGILYLAYITTKFIGKRYSVKGKSFNNMKILDTASIGQDRQLMIVKSSGKGVSHRSYLKADFAYKRA